MTKLALPDRVLLAVEKPARYIGQEMNAVIKSEDVPLRFAMCFPDVYEIGMSPLGIQIIYEQLNRREDTWCERVYAPWTDLHAIMKEEKIPLFTLESQTPVKEMDFLGFSLSYELCYSNVLQVLDLSGLPYHAAERDDDAPIVMGGGPCTYNPEPIAPFFDLFFIGESETVFDDLLDLYRKMKEEGAGKKEFLFAANRDIPGIYVPSLYTPQYHSDGTIKAVTPVDDSLPKNIRRQVCMDLDVSAYPKKPLVPYLRPVQDRVTLEIMRGCIRGCRFCQAGMVYRPLRERSLSCLQDTARAMLSNSGYDEMSLSSLSSSDYSQLAPLLQTLFTTKEEELVNISLPSLRIDNFSLDVMAKVQDVRKSSLTFAPEAGTQRLRNVINKGLTEEEILGGAAEAFRGGWVKVKLYFMLGLPFETEEDRKGIPELAQKICDVYYERPKEERRGKCDINISTSFFVPKPFTPFQWAGMHRPEEYRAYAKTVKTTMRGQKNQKSMHYEWHDTDGTVLEGILARGDRRVAPAIVKAYEKGALFDAWTDNFQPALWWQAFEECGIDVDFYTLRERGEEEIFPWDHIDIGVTKAFLLREWKKARAAEVTAHCRQACSGCGAASYGGGICPRKEAR